MLGWVECNGFVGFFWLSRVLWGLVRLAYAPAVAARG
jgi:hypothetical protein